MPKTIQSIIILAFISTGLLAQDATLEYPVGIAATSAKIYVADRQLPGIWEIVDGKPQVRGPDDKRLSSVTARCV